MGITKDVTNNICRSKKLTSVDVIPYFSGVCAPAPSILFIYLIDCGIVLKEVSLTPGSEA